MAQLQGEKLFSLGADLIIGTQRRQEVAQLLSRVIATGRPVCAVDPIPEKLPYEPLHVTRQSEHTRAVLKIQEGCRNRCSYCIIPTVRGPIRSRPPEDIREEALRLSASGFCEVVLTGIHLSSYGKDFDDGSTLLDPIRMLQDIPGIRRILLGSLEPTIATEEFSESLCSLDKVYPQFHLARVPRRQPFDAAAPSEPRHPVKVFPYLLRRRLVAAVEVLVRLHQRAARVACVATDIGRALAPVAVVRSPLLHD